MLTLMFIVFHLALVFSLFLLPEFVWVTAASLVAIVGICLAAALIKYRKSGWGHVLCNTFMYYIYFLARAVSFLTVMTGSKAKKHDRG